MKLILASTEIDRLSLELKEYKVKCARLKAKSERKDDYKGKAK